MSLRHRYQRGRWLPQISSSSTTTKGRCSHIRIQAIVDACKFPYRRARNAVLSDIERNMSKKQEGSPHLVRFFRAQPDGREVLATNHQVHIVLRPQAMGHRGQEAICIRRQVHTGQRRLQIKDGTDERRVLMRKAIMVLTCPRRCLQVINRTNIVPPNSLMCLGRKI